MVSFQEKLITIVDEVSASDYALIKRSVIDLLRMFAWFILLLEFIDNYQVELPNYIELFDQWFALLFSFIFSISKQAIKSPIYAIIVAGLSNKHSEFVRELIGFENQQFFSDLKDGKYIECTLRVGIKKNFMNLSTVALFLLFGCI